MSRVLLAWTVSMTGMTTLLRPVQRATTGRSTESVKRSCYFCSPYGMLRSRICSPWSYRAIAVGVEDTG